jgi:hypothetical protein
VNKTSHFIRVEKSIGIIRADYSQLRIPGIFIC